MNDLQPSNRAQVERLQAELSKFPQYEPRTTHHFHGGMYCREVSQDVGVLVVGKVHKCEHFLMVASGTVLISSGELSQRITGPHLLKSFPGAKRAIYSETNAVYMTFHRTDTTTVEQAEAEMVEDDESAMFAVGNKLKMEVLQ